LVDQQYQVLITMRSHEATQVVERMTLLAKGAKLFGVRTLPTTAHSETQKLVKQVQDVFPDHERTDDAVAARSWLAIRSPPQFESKRRPQSPTS
jgi:hypothetical protein